MAQNKRYFWLKLKDDFFNQKEIKMLRKIAGGDTYTVIYLKMLLLSLKTEGKIYYDGIADNIVEEIALEIDEDIENVQITFNYLSQKGLLEFSDDEIEMSEIGTMIGSETASAARKRRQRSKGKRDNVTMQSQISHDRDRDRDRDRTREDIDTDIEIEPRQEKEKSEFGSVVVEYESLGFGMITPNKSQQLKEWVDYFDSDVVIKALQVADNQNKANMNYVNGILRNWKKRQLDTVEKIEAEQRRFENMQQLPKSAQKQGEKTPDWMAKEQDHAPVDTSEMKTAEEDPELSAMIKEFRNG